MLADDRERIMCADGDGPITLADGLVVHVVNDDDGYLSAGETEDPSETEYVGAVVYDTDGETLLEDLWGIGFPIYWTGHEVREVLCDQYLFGGYDLVGNARRALAREAGEAAEWAARDTITVGVAA